MAFGSHRQCPKNPLRSRRQECRRSLVTALLLTKNLYCPRIRIDDPKLTNALVRVHLLFHSTIKRGPVSGIARYSSAVIFTASRTGMVISYFSGRRRLMARSQGAQFKKQEHWQPPCGPRADNRGRDALLRVLSMLLNPQRIGSSIELSGARTRGSASLPSCGKTGPFRRNENYPKLRTAPAHFFGIEFSV